MKKMWFVFSLCVFVISFSIVSSAETEVQIAEIPEYMKASNVFTEDQLELLSASEDLLPFDVNKINEYRVLLIYGMKIPSYYAHWERPLEYYTENPYLYGYVVFSDSDCHFISCSSRTVLGQEELYFEDGMNWEYSAARGIMPAEYRSIASQMYLAGAMRTVNNVTVLGNLEHGIFSIYYLTDDGTFIKHFGRSDPEGVVDQSSLFTEERFREVRSILYADLRERLDYYAELSKETGMVYVGGEASPFYPLAEEAGIEFEYAVPGNPIPEHLQPKAAQDPTTPEKSSWNGWLIGCAAAGVLGIAAMAIPVFLRKRKAKSPATENE